MAVFVIWCIWLDQLLHLSLMVLHSLYATVLLSAPWLTHLMQLGSKPNLVYNVSRGGLGLCRLSLHSPAAYIASAIASDCSSPQSKHLLHAIDLFNASVSTIDELTNTTITTSKLTQNLLSAKLEDQQFTKLFVNASLPDRARSLSLTWHLPQGSTFILIPLSFKLPLSGG